jgi:4-hydroxy-2-oxoheptanedioate aldolase
MQNFVGPHSKITSLTTADYLLQANDILITIVQIEILETLRNVNFIASVDSVDVLLVGPFDLGNNIGHPILTDKMDKELIDAIDNILKAAQNHGKRTGIYCTSGEQAREYAEKGFNMISVAADMIAIPAYFSQVLSIAKGAEGKTEKTTRSYER